MANTREYFAVIHDCLKYGVEDPVISVRLDELGYPGAELDALNLDLTAAEGAYNLSTTPKGEQVAATQTFGPLLDCIGQDLSDLRAMMNNNLERADPLFIQLGLNEKQPRGQDDFLGYAVRVFTSGAALSAADIAPLAKRKWDTARFTAAMTQATQVQALNDEQEAAKSASVAATAHLYDLIDALDAKFRPLAKDARRGLAKIPGALAKMQLEKSVPNKPQRPADKKASQKPAKGQTPGA